MYTNVLCMYNSIPLRFVEYNVLNLATRIVLDIKLFFKEWPFMDDLDDNLLRFICYILSILAVWMLYLQRDISKERYLKLLYTHN